METLLNYIRHHSSDLDLGLDLTWSCAYELYLDLYTVVIVFVQLYVTNRYLWLVICLCYYYALVVHMYFRQYSCGTKYKAKYNSQKQKRWVQNQTGGVGSSETGRHGSLETGVTGTTDISDDLGTLKD